MIIDAEMYGITPKANIEKFFSAPPPIVLSNSRNPKLLLKLSVPGTLILIPKMKKLGFEFVTVSQLIDK